MKTRTLVGLVASGIWTLVFVCLAVWKRSTIAGLELNAWGDFFAGYAAPLALLWLVLGYLQQGEELEANTRALLAQQQELKDQVAQTKRLAEASSRQAQASEKLATLSDLEHQEQTRAARAHSLMDLRLQQSSGTSESTLSLALRNHGAPAKQISVSTEPNLRYRLSPNEVIENGRYVDLTLYGPIVFPVRIRFDYINRLKESEHQTYDLLGPNSFAERHDA